METKIEIARLTVELPVASHKKLKTKAALEGKTIKEIVSHAIEMSLEETFGPKECSLSHEPNEETAKAIKEAKQGIGLIKSKDLDDLFKKLDI